ncbi:MAG: PH domain-containing protein [Candidatus Phosphoribacter sp.]|nr:PH domain-containing protein [Actinomycetales bacterium]
MDEEPGADVQGPHSRLRDPAWQVCPRARWLWAIQGGLWAAVLVAGQVGWWFLDRRGPRDPHLVVALISGVLIVAYLVVMPRWRFRVHRWEVSATAVYTQSGWLSRERRIAPISRIQTVDLTRGPAAQALRLATVRVTTASAAGPLVIEGLDQHDAVALVESLTAVAAAERGDAT